MNAWAITDKGLSRKENQDSYFSYCDDEKKIAILVVCDGMGGAKAGNVASELACETFVEEIKNGIADADSCKPVSVAKMITSAISIANSVVHATSVLQPEFNGMGTTLVATLVINGRAAVVNVGDSRAYHIKDDGIVQISRDHSVVQDMVERGELTQEESRTHPRKNLITRALGTSPNIECDIFYPEMSEGDYILLCSDGLSNLVNDQEILYEIRHGENIDDCGNNLLKIALDRGAPDNITLILFRM